MSPSVFAHGVASGDPTTDRVLIWTRITTGDETVPVSWTVAADPELRRPVASGEAVARPEHDHTVHVDVEGLEAGTTYFYGFGAGGETSPVARTRTLPADGVERIRFAICSCAKFNAGYFNAYARIAERGDISFLLHLGDYIYEASNIPAKGQTPGADIGRDFDPLGECRTLEEYRTRYAQYRRDPEVQAMHHALPVIATIDDHELADGAWAGGSDAHDPDLHGPWADRKHAAFQARWEWLPARPPDPNDPSRVFRQISIAGLADILLLDIRSRRDQPALEPRMSDPSRSMMGTEQRDWLLSSLAASKADWRLLATPSILTRTWFDDAPEHLATALLKLKLMDEDGQGPDEDQWDGYPAERQALLDGLREVDDVVVLSGDIHVSAATEVRDADEVVSVEITTPSLTSQNLDEKLGIEPRSGGIVEAERAYMERLDQVQWCDFAAHGYVVIDVDPTRVRAEWWHVDGVLERLPGERRAACFEVPRGEPRLAPSSS